jgi:fructokinase
MARVIIVAGEALIDLIVRPDGRVVAVPGGGPFNTARTIGRLGLDVAFLGGISADQFGRQLAGALEADGVDLRWTRRTDAPTTLAIAEVDEDGTATYRFHIDGTASVGLTLDDARAAFGGGPSAVHVGTLGLAVEPLATALTAAVAELPRTTLLMVDPNCRSAVIADPVAYVGRLRRVLTRAAIVKASVEDLAYITPGTTPVDAARLLVASGAGVVLVTDGPRPVRVVAHRVAFEMSVPSVKVVDTVGSGDAFGAAFLARWIERGLGRADTQDEAALRDAVALAIEVAGITSRRPGADPPRRAKVPGWRVAAGMD